MEDLSDFPIDGIVEGYFENDKYSAELKEKIKEYETLALSDILDEVQKSRLYKLNVELREIPRKLAPELKLKFLQIETQRRAKAHLNIAKISKTCSPLNFLRISNGQKINPTTLNPYRKNGLPLVFNRFSGLNFLFSIIKNK